YASVVVFAFYIYGSGAAGLYHHPSRMWLMTPLIILWLSRVWLLASRGELNEDPVIFAVTDRMSLLIGAGIALIAVLAAIPYEKPKKRGATPPAMAKSTPRPRLDCWARYPTLQAELRPLNWTGDFPLTKPPATRLLPVGAGRSYGDVCLL